MHPSNATCLRQFRRERRRYSRSPPVWPAPASAGPFAFVPVVAGPGKTEANRPRIYSCGVVDKAPKTKGSGHSGWGRDRGGPIRRGSSGRMMSISWWPSSPARATPPCGVPSTIISCGRRRKSWSGPSTSWRKDDWTPATARWSSTTPKPPSMAGPSPTTSASPPRRHPIADALVHLPVLVEVVRRPTRHRCLVARLRAVRRGLPGRPARSDLGVLPDRVAHRPPVRSPSGHLARCGLHHPLRSDLAGQRFSAGAARQPSVGHGRDTARDSNVSPARSPSIRKGATSCSITPTSGTPPPGLPLMTSSPSADTCEAVGTGAPNWRSATVPTTS